MTLRNFCISIGTAAVPFLALASSASALDMCKPIKIAIVDTGLDLSDSRFAGHICKTGHKNFVTFEPMKDLQSHGTHIAGLIQQYAGEGNYCFVIYKYYSDQNSGSTNLKNTVASFKLAVKNKVTYVNYSGGGPEFAEDEYLAIKNSPQTTFIVAAGNEHSDIDLIQNAYYPACYKLKNELIVGGVDINGRRTASSNYGKSVTNWELGELVKSYVPFEIASAGTAYISGTSQATAIKTGKLVAQRLRMCNSH